MSLGRLLQRLWPGKNTPAELRHFDWKFYVRFYPDLKRNGVDSRKKAELHWLQTGRAEGRIGGPHDPACRRNFQALTDYLQTVGRRAAEARRVLANRTPPLIHILTRSNQRPRFFQENRASVAAQTYRSFRQLVSYENPETLRYLQRAGVPESDAIHVTRKTTSATHPYNLFVNDLMGRVEDGWILFLDDDDLFTTPEALTILASRLVDENQLVIWKAWFPDKIVPFVNDAKAIQPGGMTSCCFAFHARHKADAQWHEHKAGDYRCFDQLRNKLPAVILDDILTRVNYTDASAGWGEPRDKK
ncbi:MAG: hypothetical protein U1F65_09305 [Verrucomicrobiota bacterium]